VNGPELIVQPPHMPSIVASSVLDSYTFSGNWATWRFEFDTIGTADFVRVIFTKNPVGVCAVLPADKDLQPGDPGVIWTVVPVGGGVYHHVVTWTNVSCQAPCSYDYKVEAKYQGAVATSATFQLLVNICGGYQ
jgi:hypothetical protein